LVAVRLESHRACVDLLMTAPREPAANRHFVAGADVAALPAAITQRARVAELDAPALGSSGPVAVGPPLDDEERVRIGPLDFGHDAVHARGTSAVVLRAERMMRPGRAAE